MTESIQLSRRSVLGAALVGSGAVLAPVSAARAAPTPDPGRVRRLDNDVIYETSFETDEADWQDIPTSYDTTEAHTGERSLRYERTDAEEYVLVATELAVEPGVEYEIRCAVKTADLDGAYNRGARIALEGYDGDSWISGAYSANIRAEDWVMTQTRYTAPENATHVRAVVYLFKGLLGTAWFDDLTVQVVEPEGFSTELLSPTYRGLLIPGDHDTVSLRSRVLFDDDVLADYTVTTTVLDADGEIVDEQSSPAAAVVEHSVSADSLAVGRHSVRSELIHSGTGEVESAEEWGLEKVATAPPTYIDRHRRLIRNGEPFFPLGMYHSRIDQAAMDDLSGTPFNTIMPYAPQDSTALDLAEANGISVAYSLKDFFFDSTQGAKPKEIETEADEVPTIIARVNQLRDHPALLAWYMSDEAPAHAQDRLAAHYEAVVENDPDHPAWAVHYQAPSFPSGWLLRTMDAYGMDCYPVTDGAGPLTQVTERSRTTAERLPNRAMWHVPQSFAWGALSGRTGRFPTEQEFRNMTWQFLCEGATGIMYWELHYMHIDPDLSFDQAMAIATTVGQEVADLVPILMSVDEPPAATLPGEFWLGTLLKSSGDSTHLFTVNSTREDQSASFTVPGAITVTVVGEDRTITPAGDGSFSDDFEALAIHHYDIAVVTFAALAELTHELLSQTGEPGWRGLDRAAGRMLKQSEAASRVDQPEKVNQHLADYRSLIEAQSGRALTVDQATRLVELSEHLAH